MKSHAKISLQFMLYGSIIGAVGTWAGIKINNSFRKNYFEKIRNNLQVYAYDTTAGSLNVVFYFKDIDDFQIIRKYYENRKQRKSGYLPRQILMFPFDKRLYLLDSTSSPDYSELALVVDSQYQIRKGFVLKHLIHHQRADSALLIRANRHYDSLTNRKRLK